MSKTNGGPAFPTTQADVERGWDGMSLRDWFAGQALAGLVANDSARGDNAQFAIVAYALADAMLAERERRV